MQWWTEYICISCMHFKQHADNISIRLNTEYTRWWTQELKKTQIIIVKTNISSHETNKRSMLEFSFLPKNPKKELTKLPYQNPSKKLIKQYSLFVFFVFFFFGLFHFHPYSYAKKTLQAGVVACCRCRCCIHHHYLLLGSTIHTTE